MAQTVRGAIYIPTRAFNAWQMWRDYDPAIIERDLGYAQRLRLNALRVWLSYEQWSKDPQRFLRSFEHMLDSASRRGMRVMPSLFERCGIEPTQQSMNDRDPATAVCLRSPPSEVVDNPQRWREPARFVDAIMDRFASDDRLLAIEIINEPQTPSAMRFARRMFATADGRRGSIPLTIGALVPLHNLYYLDLGIDIFQAHLNFPQSEQQFLADAQKASDIAAVVDRPLWITEWQRLRPHGAGWGDEPILHDEWQPAYATLAPLVQSLDVGSFFWSLMLKPAYLPQQRNKGTINGVFHEDGAVWSVDDARAISGDDTFEASERRFMQPWPP